MSSSNLKIGLVITFTLVLILIVTYNFFTPKLTTFLFKNEGSTLFIKKEATNTPKQNKSPQIHQTLLFWTTMFRAKFRSWNLTCGNVQCRVTSDRNLVASSHAVIFHAWDTDMTYSSKGGNGEVTYHKDLPPQRHPDQYWVLYGMEPPMFFSARLQAFKDEFNWTMTYRKDSDIYIPYLRFQNVPTPGSQNSTQHLQLAKREKLVALVLSNCRDVPSDRLRLIHELQKHISVDIYGKCGPLECPESTCKRKLGKQYKFYLSFENSICQDYITEKLCQAIDAEMLPIVYGGGNYDEILPPGSYIDVNNFPSAKSLADYLLRLNSRDEEYLQYFEWRKFYKLTLCQIDYSTAFCHMCQKLAGEKPQGTSIVRNITDFIFNFPGGQPRCWKPKIWQ